ICIHCYREPVTLGIACLPGNARKGFPMNDSTRSDAASEAPASPLPRRALLAGAGAAGAALVAAKMMPAVLPAEPVAAVVAKPAVGATAAGYRLSAHVQRYYETTRI
ncbi:MAG TPA: hypothetical protein VNU71_11385, partial [Burkholderiaceae bacterium]|nr:hypothetical protein [Burkholderiaceae bacterium]